MGAHENRFQDAYHPRCLAGNGRTDDKDGHCKVCRGCHGDAFVSSLLSTWFLWGFLAEKLPILV